MSNDAMNRVVHQLRKTLLVQHTAELTDRQLLDRFLHQHEEEAFEALVRRHGPMVLAVCRRVLRHAQDAEDAFQATFLVLVRKAGSIRRQGAVGSWLYGVAYRTALKARGAAARRRLKEGEMTRRAAPAEDDFQEWLPVLDQELGRLPEKYRAAVVLCDLEGLTRKEAGRQLGCSESTLSSRVTRGRALLARRLARHGLTVTAGSLALALSRGARAGVPAPLTASTIQAAACTAAGKATAGVISARVAALTEGVLKVMLLAKLRNLAALLLVAGLAVVLAGTVAYRALAQQASPRTRTAETAPDDNAEAATTDDADTNDQLPTGPMPVQALARMDKGQLAVKFASVTTRETQAPGPNGWPNGWKIVTTIRTTATNEFPLKDVQVYDTRGRRLDARDVSRLLRKEARVLVSQDGKKVDPLHLKLVKEGTLIVVLPVQLQVPNAVYQNMGGKGMWVPGNAYNQPLYVPTPQVNQMTGQNYPHAK